MVTIRPKVLKITGLAIIILVEKLHSDTKTGDLLNSFLACLSATVCLDARIGDLCNMICHWDGMGWNGMGWLGMVLGGIGWYGMVLDGNVWDIMGWYGMV